MMILAIAGLGIIATLTRVMIAQSSSSHHTVAKLIAESELENAILAGPPNWGATPGNVTEIRQREAMVGQSDHPTIFYFQIEEDPIPLSNQNESGDIMFGNSPNFPDMGDLYEVKVKIWWNSDAAPSGAVERGTQELRVSKVVYIET